MLSCSIGRSCLTSLALAFLTVCDVRVKGSRLAVTSCHTPKSNTLPDTYASLFSIVFFSIRIPRYFQEFGKRHPQALIQSGRCVIFKKKKSKISITPMNYDYKKKSTFTNAGALFSLSYVSPRLALAPRGLRAHDKSVESHTHTVSSRVTLARESCQMHSVRVYSRHYRNCAINLC